MIITTKTKYRINMTKIETEAINAAFGENRLTVNEAGLSPAAIEAKKTVIAYREMSQRFVRAVYTELSDRGIRITSDHRRIIEAIAIEALRRGADGADYLRHYCEEASDV